MFTESQSKKQVNLEAGIKLQVNIQGIATPVNSFLIGLEANQYLIIKPPNPFESVKHKLFPGTEFIIKFLDEGKIVAFKSKLIDFVSKPFKLVFIEFPKKFVHHDLRSTERINCAIPAKTTIKGGEKEAIIVDMSPKGCGVSIRFSKDENQIAVSQGEIITLKCLFPGMSGEQNIYGLIRNIKNKNLEIILGIQFVDLEEELQQKIEDFIEVIKERM
ncbi:MAG: flagellar brake protein [Desulfobacterales bacterium]|nr:flagellar brake protein [Desulfobacterales bacterium]MBF0395602.1 flagellar brake protein [Desulfobacterales bacterium]